MKVRLEDRRVQIVVMVALSLVVIHNVRHFALRNKTARRPVEMEVAASGIMVEPETPRWASADYAAASEWGRDPFDPAGGTRASNLESGRGRSEGKVPTPPPPQARITGIGMIGDSRFVLAGDKILREGDRIGTGTIKKIGTKSVVIEHGGGTNTINID